MAEAAKKTRATKTAKPKAKRTAAAKKPAAKRKVKTPAQRAAAKAAKEAAQRQEQEALVKQYFPYATSIANRVSKSLNGAVDYDDILCYARLGLLEAAQRYDAAYQVDFRTFAYYRIKGAIFDGLRKSGWIPRSLYSKIKSEEAANDHLQYMSHREAHDEQKKRSDADPATTTVNSLASIYVISLDANEELDVADENAVDMEERATLQQVRNHMRTAISQLPTKEKQLIMMYYFQNRTLEEAGQRLKLSKSWTSRLHARALEMLMKNIREVATDGTSVEKILEEGLQLGGQA